MDGGALPVSTAGVVAEGFAQASQSIRRWQEPRNRYSGDVAGQVQELLTQCRMDQKSLHESCRPHQAQHGEAKPFQGAVMSIQAADFSTIPQH